ncbi:MAG: hypothetical protein ACK46X_02945 [Candidatus Sericytochromatia bacterium]
MTAFQAPFKTVARWMAIATLTLAAGCAATPAWTATAAPAGAFTAQSTAASADDAVKRAILSGPEVPRTVAQVRARLLGQGGRLKTHIVNNRGHENPEAGSFSFFETYTGPMTGGAVKDGELFIGFFSERQGDALAVMQSFEPGLMIELIAWDYTKQAYNFWELIGTGKSAEWHYRGDSADVLADVAAVNMGQTKPAFGARLRCSGCHTLGGPIMKELDTPNNDWWTDAHKLELGSMKLQAGSEATAMATQLFKDAVDASDLSRQVDSGMKRLMQARAARGGDGQSLQQQLRSLFTPMEINLASDTTPFKTRSDVALPAAFFLDARLTGPQPGIPVTAAQYRSALAEVGSRFAPDEANREETRHAFVVPVRSAIDNMAIDGLVRRGLLDEELIADVLAVDATNPLHSKARASLLRFVPDQAASVAALRAGLVASLQKAPQDAAAKELLANLTDPARTAAFHRKRAIAVLQALRAARANPAAVVGWLKLASQRRAEVAAAETSQNPRGTILEPGFRVIFPVDRVNARPGALRLNPANGLVEANR